MIERKRNPLKVGEWVHCSFLSAIGRTEKGVPVEVIDIFEMTTQVRGIDGVVSSVPSSCLQRRATDDKADEAHERALRIRVHHAVDSLWATLNGQHPDLQEEMLNDALENLGIKDLFAVLMEPLLVDFTNGEIDFTKGQPGVMRMIGGEE